MVKLLDTPTAEHPHIKHEMVATTQVYLHANLAIKQKALDPTTPVHSSPGRYRPTDKVLAFLEGL